MAAAFATDRSVRLGEELRSCACVLPYSTSSFILVMQPYDHKLRFVCTDTTHVWLKNVTIAELDGLLNKCTFDEFVRALPKACDPSCMGLQSYLRDLFYDVARMCGAAMQEYLRCEAQLLRLKAENELIRREVGAGTGVAGAAPSVPGTALPPARKAAFKKREGASLVNPMDKRRVARGAKFAATDDGSGDTA